MKCRQDGHSCPLGMNENSHSHDDGHQASEMGQNNTTTRHFRGTKRPLEDTDSAEQGVVPVIPQSTKKVATVSSDQMPKDGGKHSYFCTKQ